MLRVACRLLFGISCVLCVDCNVLLDMCLLRGDCCLSVVVWCLLFVVCVAVLCCVVVLRLFCEGLLFGVCRLRFVVCCWLVLL